MEKCVDSEFMLLENDASNTSEIATCTHDSGLSDKPEEKDKSKDCCNVSRVHKKIASKERSSGPSDLIQGDVKLEKTRRHPTRTKLNVLNKHVTETSRQSVQTKTKIIKRNVPDRLGKYVSYRVRSETKILLNECKPETKSSPSECSPETLAQSSGDILKVNDMETETKIAVLENECLINKEADRLRNSFESDLETKNIFENFFDDCLDSTSNGKEVSSHANLYSREMLKSNAVEKTPEKKKAGLSSTNSPVKIKDHSSYYSSHKNIRHVCAYCHKIFKNNGKLNSHVYSHTGERPFDCNHCGKAFSSKFKLVRHLLIHSEVRKFVCQICDRTFLRNDHLKNHYKVHDPQKKMYKCSKENCDKEYSSIMSHKKHMAYHNVEDGDLKCLICNVKYETKEEILFHLKSHSGSRLFKSQSDKKFKCQFCERLFLTRKDVTRHLVVHTGERDFLCQFCPQRFGRKDHLVRHIKKSHGNEDLVRSEEVKTSKEETKKADEDKANEKTGKTVEPETPKITASSKENNTQAEENKTHIVITVQEKTLQNRGRRKLQKKPFQKSELLVPKKKQVPLAKVKGPTTQILLQNIPNILIIPNNSIILLRNQSANKKIEEESRSVEPEPSSAPEPQFNQDLLPPVQTPNTTDFVNFGYDASTFPPSSQFLGGFQDSDNFCNFQPDLPSFGSQFDEPDFEMLSQNDLLPRADVGFAGDAQASGSLLEDTHRGLNPTPGKSNREKTECDELFDNENDGLMLTESILNDFKDDSPAILPADNDSGLLGNILNQSNDNCGFELLRHLLTSENPVLSPLPGFSQIFHNSNANSN